MNWALYFGGFDLCTRWRKQTQPQKSLSSLFFVRGKVTYLMTLNWPFSPNWGNFNDLMRVGKIIRFKNELQLV